MGNTSSRKKSDVSDKKMPIPLVVQAENLSSIATPATASKGPENPLAVVELCEKIVGHLEERKIKDLGSSQEPINPISALVNTSIFYHAIVQKPRLARLCALYTAQSNEEQVKKLFAISPSHITYILIKTSFMDFRERKFNCSAFQYALWARDMHMLTTMLESLDQAEASALPRNEWDKIPEEKRRRAPFLGILTKEDIAAIRATLFEQYTEVVDKGLDYIITRYDRLQDARLKYQLINSREVKVIGETHFDLIGPEFCLMPLEEEFPTVKGKFYIRIEDGMLHYRVISLSGQLINDHIPLAALECPLVELNNLDQLKPYIHKIFKITSEKDHTHTQALISAFNTFVFYQGAEEKWVSLVGMAERDVPAVVAQWFCHTGTLANGKQLDSVQGQLQRSLNVDFDKSLVDLGAPQRGYWFPLTSDNRLGLDFAIIRGLTIWHYDRAGSGAYAAHAQPRTYFHTNQLLKMVKILCIDKSIAVAELSLQLNPEKSQDLVPSPRP